MYTKIGYWTAFGTYCVLAVAAYHLSPVQPVINDMIQLYTGEVEAIRTGDRSFYAMLPVLLWVLVLDFPVTFFGLFISGLIAGEAQGSHYGESRFVPSPQAGKYFLRFFGLVILEELFARWLFLGVLMKIPILPVEIRFFILFLLGNSIWALIHLYNYEHDADRHVIRVLPQFIGGVFYTYLFLKFGLLTCTLAHFGFNALLFSLHKVHTVEFEDVLDTFLNLVYVVVAYVFLEKPAADLTVWLTAKEIAPLPGWKIQDYLWATILLSSSMTVVANILLYDRKRNINEEGGRGSITEWIVGTVLLMLMIPLVYGINYGAFWVAGWVISEVQFQLLFAAILLACMSTTHSGSATMRQFWISIPNTFLFICITQALGWKGALMFISMLVLLDLPSMLVKRCFRE